MKSLGRACGVAVFILFAAPTCGCKQILGLHERAEAVEAGAPDSGDTTPVDAAPDVERPNPVVGRCGSLEHFSQACADCMDTSCCAEAMACGDDASCQASYACISECGDDGACRQRCTQFYNRGEPLIQLTACRGNSCAIECGATCGGFGYQGTGCDQCVRSSCCEAASACAKDLDCQRLDLCRANCLAGSTACPVACNAQYPNGTAAYGTWFNCTANTCASACQAGSNWQCLSNGVIWLKPKGLADIKFSVSIVDLLTEGPFVGATVKACKKVDFSCGVPLAQTTTDSAGLAEVKVPAGSVGFDGYLEISGGDNGTGGGSDAEIFPALWYPTPPVIAPGWRGRVQFVSRGELPMLGSLTGANIDPQRGHFAANAVDCNFASAGGVVFSADVDPSDAEIKKFYFLMGFPSIAATQTDAQTGIGGFVNLPAKALTVTAMVAAENKQVAALVYNIRSGWFTTTSIPPSPMQ